MSEFPNYFGTAPATAADSSWRTAFGAPSVAQSDYSSAFSSTGPSFNPSAFDPSFSIPSAPYRSVESFASAPASSNWMDYLKAGGLAMSAAGDAIRAFRGEPIFPGSSPFQQLLAQERQKEEDKRQVEMLKAALGPSSSTDLIAGVLDPAAEKRSKPKAFGELPSLARTAGSSFRLAGSFLG
jgi:hypothetical protein